MHSINKEKENKVVLVTKSIESKDVAIRRKMHQVEPRLFGIKLIQYQRKGANKVWLPYYIMKYDFKINRNLFFAGSKLFSKEGRIAIIFDANEMHGSYYDVNIEGELPLVRRELINLKGNIVYDKEDFNTICRQAEKIIQRQILFKTYKIEGELKYVEAVRFYREAWQLQLSYKDKHFYKYAYLDGFGIKNDRARGLRARID